MVILVLEEDGLILMVLFLVDARYSAWLMNDMLWRSSRFLRFGLCRQEDREVSLNFGCRDLLIKIVLLWF